MTRRGSIPRPGGLVGIRERIAEIAAALHLSQKTVQNYHYGIKAKVGARTDASLVWLALEAGLVSPGRPEWFRRTYPINSAVLQRLASPLSGTLTWAPG